MLNEKEMMSKVLEELIYDAEKLIQKDEACSILILDENGLLRNGASPKLPQDYLKAIDKLRPDPSIGTCSAAAATGQIVVTTNFKDDNKWSELKHLPLSLGYTGAFSIPILKDDKVLGTFGVYLRRMRVPSMEEIETFKPFSALASQIIWQNSSPAFY